MQFWTGINVVTLKKHIERLSQQVFAVIKSYEIFFTGSIKSFFIIPYSEFTIV